MLQKQYHKIILYGNKIEPICKCVYFNSVIFYKKKKNQYVEHEF